LAVPEMADPEDAAALVADAAATSALEVRHAVGVEGHLPAPGATVVRPGRRQPWQVVAVTADTLRLRDLAGDVAEVSRRSVRPDPLDVPAALEAFDTRSRGSRCWQEMAVSVWSMWTSVSWTIVYETQRKRPELEPEQLSRDPCP